MARRDRAAALVVASVSASCSDDSETASPATSRARTTTTASREPQPVPTTVVLVATEQDLRDCDRTIEPFFRRGPGEPSGLPLPLEPLVGEDLEFDRTSIDPAGPVNPSTFWGDLDADGVDDTLTQTDAGIVVVSGPLPARIHTAGPGTAARRT